MFEALIIGAGTSLVLSGFYFLFKKPSKKIHIYVQNAVLVLLAIICFFALIFSLTIVDEFTILLLPILIEVVPGEIIIIMKLYKNIQKLKNNEFEE